MSAKIENIPTLGDWVNITEASEILGMERQSAYKAARKGRFKTLHQIGTKPSYVVSKAELEEIKAERERSQSDE